jgi:hypothetical protein
MSILSTIKKTTPSSGSRVAERLLLSGREEHPMQTPIRSVYEQFVARHYAEKPLRHPVHVEAVIGAAGVRPTDVSEEFWEELRPEWLWGASPLPFTGPKSRKANAQYRRLCELKGVAP